MKKQKNVNFSLEYFAAPLENLRPPHKLGGVAKRALLVRVAHISPPLPSGAPYSSHQQCRAATQRGFSRSVHLLARPECSDFIKALPSGRRARSHLQRAAQIQGFHSIFFGFIILSLLITVGCGQRQDIEEVKKAVLESDPSFKDALAKKAELDSEIELIMGEFRRRQGEINSKIMELEEELKGARRQAYSQISELKAKLNPERQRITLKLNELRTTLKSKEGLLRTLKDSIKETKKVIEKNKRLDISQKEEAKWQQNLNDLDSQLPSLEDEIANLKRDIELYRRELNLLKQ